MVWGGHDGENPPWPRRSLSSGPRETTRQRIHIDSSQGMPALPAASQCIANGHHEGHEPEQSDENAVNHTLAVGSMQLAALRSHRRAGTDFTEKHGIETDCSSKF